MEQGKRLYKSSTNKVLDGVCAGVGDYFDIDPTLIRVATVLLGVFTGGIGMLIAYIIMACIIPRQPEY